MKMLIDTFVNAVFLYDDKMVLTYNFRESTETITFGELQVVLPNGFRGSDAVRIWIWLPSQKRA